MFKVSVFLKERENTLFPLLYPLQFSLRKGNKLVWAEGEQEFIIEPFSVKGRVLQGYRISFNGDPDSFQYLFNYSLSCFAPSINGIDYYLETNESQAALVHKANQSYFTRGTMPGLYEHKGIGIVIFPDGKITFQIRNQLIRQSQLAKLMKDIESVSRVFASSDINIFSMVEQFEEGIFVS